MNKYNCLEIFVYSNMLEHLLCKNTKKSTNECLNILEAKNITNIFTNEYICQDIIKYSNKFKYL